MGSSSPLTATFYGHIASTHDALILFEACLSGNLNHVARRPHDRERASLIKSGNVFIYEEHSSGIKRWTDGVPWSPSRILGNFLVYRELERPFPPGEKKRAMKRNKRSPALKAPEPYGGLSSSYDAAAGSGFEAPGAAGASLNKETERSLIGSLVDSYGFKNDGLVKKTVSVSVGGVSHHLVSYYTVADVVNNKFITPSKHITYQHITPRADLITKQNFRTPIDEIDTLDRMDERAVYGSYPYARNGYEMTNQSISHRSLSLPTPPVSYTHNPGVFGNYAIGATPGTYGDHFAPAGTNGGYHGPFASSPSMYPVTKVDNQDHGTYRQQRYNSMAVPSDSMRSHAAPPVGTEFSRRASAFEHPGGSIDSGISGVSAASVESKVTHDSGYPSQAFYGGMREATHPSQSYHGQREPPAAGPDSAYERSHDPYAIMAPPKENAWPVGNASAGHGHYMAPQQWTSTGTS